MISPLLNFTGKLLRQISGVLDGTADYLSPKEESIPPTVVMSEDSGFQHSFNNDWLDRFIGKVKEKHKVDLRDYILYTDKDPQSWQFYKRQEASDWTAEEFNFSKEAQEYKTAPENIKKLFKGIGGFFLIGDGLIGEEVLELIERAIERKNWPKVFYLVMKLKVEMTHIETYSKAFLTIVPKEEHQELFDMCIDLPCVKNKGQFLQEFGFGKHSEFIENVVCAVGEGIFFTGLFSEIFFMRRLGMFANFIESNEQISKDETTHRDEACAEAQRLLNNASEKDIDLAYKIIARGVQIEKEHIDYLLQFPILGEQADKDAGFTRENHYLYAEKLANEICHLIGLDLLYPDNDVTLKWMEEINMSQKSNFYERDVIGNYRKFDPNSIGVEENPLVYTNPLAVLAN